MPDSCTGLAIHSLVHLIAIPMAVDPSNKSNDKSRKHTRNVASVVPVLPLPPSDKKWRKPSINESVSPKPEASVELQESRPAPTTDEKPVEVQKDAQATNVLDAQTQESVRTHGTPTNGLSNHINDSVNGFAQTESPIPDIVEDIAPPVDVEVQDEGPQIRSRSSTLIALDPDTRGVSPLSRPSSLYHTVSDAQPEATVGVEPTQLLEEDTQASDPDTSVQRSNTTGLTDYGSTAGESNLETVVEPQRPNKSAFQHRQSEAAPEALLNGHSPSSRTDKTSQRMNVSVSSQPPRLPTLQEHLLFLAATKSASDLAIHLVQPDRAYRPTVHNVHSLFMMRSPRITSLIPEYDQTTSSRVINIFPVRNVLPHAFDAALRFFYSDQTLTADSLLSPQILRDKQAKVQSLDYIMSYWIAGVELGLDPIKARAYEFIQQIVGWDTVELIVKEIQDLRRAEESLTEGHDKFEIRGVADTLLSLVAQLFVEGLNMQDFNLDPNAQVTAIPTRLSHLESRSNNPALSAMIFGSLPAQAMPTPSVDSVASAILLNMNFNELQLLVSELIAWHGLPAQTVLHYLIHLREERREQIISNATIPNKDRLSHSTAWDAAGWKEFIQDGRLNRERVGFLLPTRGR